VRIALYRHLVSKTLNAENAKGRGGRREEPIQKCFGFSLRSLRFSAICFRYHCRSFGRSPLVGLFLLIVPGLRRGR
jgi:hypothetical protein